MLNTGHGVSVCHRWYNQLKFLLVNLSMYRLEYNVFRHESFPGALFRLGLSLWGVSSAGIMGGGLKVGLLPSLLFSSYIVAVDPVAVSTQIYKE